MKKIILTLTALASLTMATTTFANLHDTDAQLRGRTTVAPEVDGQWRMWGGPEGSISQWISPETGRVEFVIFVKRSGAYSTDTVKTILIANLPTEYVLESAWTWDRGVRQTKDGKYFVTYTWTKDGRNCLSYYTAAGQRVFDSQ